MPSTDQTAAPTQAELKAGGAAANNPRVLAAARHDDIGRLGVTEVMQKFRLNHAAASAARKIARKTNPKVFVEGEEKRLAAREFRRAVAAEKRYPMVHRMLTSDEPLSAVGDKYGVSRAMAHQMLVLLRSVAGDTTPEKLEAAVKAVEKQAKGL